ncbi:MAG: radical SAM protein [Desulfosarcinaceae bacterium]|jgi:radical SAM superfamily enzyme YgiQ (UPF0313 family)
MGKRRTRQKASPRHHSNTARGAAETGATKKGWAGRLRIALVYPNTYAVGMSNLGFQTVYQQLNAFDGVVCERAFLPDAAAGRPRGAVVSEESARPLTDFDLIAFSVAFENDYPNVLSLLAIAGLPLRANDRGAPFPLVVAGGVTCFLNPEPLAAFVDLFLLGEAEPILPTLVARLAAGDPKSEAGRRQLLLEIAREVPGAYVPRFYAASYLADGTLAALETSADVPTRIQRIFAADLKRLPTETAILTEHTTFDATHLVEVSRGCPHGCRFCSAGYIYRPPRFRPLELLKAQVDRAKDHTDRIGLVGAAVSDLPELAALCRHGAGNGLAFSFSSLRADALGAPLIEQLRRSGVKTATIAPDAGSERMRRVINKGIDEEQILTAAEALVAGGIPNLKLYFMVGLPSETDADIEAITRLVKKIKHHFLRSSRARGRMGDITVSLSSFVPKPATPFQWAPMAEEKPLKARLKKIKSDLNRVANVRVHSDMPRWAFIQALFARGDRRVADLLEAAHRNQGNWPQTFKAAPLNPQFYVYRERLRDEALPWDFIDHGVRKSFLWNEYQRALEAKPTPPCPATPETCSICGACNGKG